MKQGQHLFLQETASHWDLENSNSLVMNVALLKFSIWEQALKSKNSYAFAA